MFFKEKIVNEILSRISGIRPFFILIIGPNGVGKTCLASDICESIGNIPIGSRHFAIPKEVRKSRFLHALEPESYKLNEMIEVIHSISNGEKVNLFLTGRKEGLSIETENYLFHSQNQIVVLEGLPWIHCINAIPEEKRLVVSLFHRNLEDWLFRAISRDITERGYGEFEIKESILRRVVYLQAIKHDIFKFTDIAFSTNKSNDCEKLDCSKILETLDSYYTQLINCITYLLDSL